MGHGKFYRLSSMKQQAFISVLAYTFVTVIDKPLLFSTHRSDIDVKGWTENTNTCVQI